MPRPRARPKDLATDISTRRRAYLAAQSPAARKQLTRFRRLVRTTVPEAVEAFSYGIPGFRLRGKILVWYAGWKAHWSIYPFTAAIQRTFERELKPYPRSRGTIRFPLEEPLPVALVTRLLKARAREALAGGARTIKPAARTF